MIEGIRAWSRGILISVIITIVLEMILPENSSKKYIKIIIGIFIVYSIISPIFENFSENNVDKLISTGEHLLQASARHIQL